MRKLIFTDLDGTLLNHDDYRFDEAKGWLERLKNEGVGVVLNTSKTYEEVRGLQRELGIKAPFAVENGGAVFYPPEFLAPDLKVETDGWRCEPLGASAEALLAFIEAHRALAQVAPLSQMTPEAISERTGLDLSRARLAKARRFSQPFFFESGDLAGFEAAAKAAGYALTRGGRFYHLLAANQNKGRALRAVKTRYEALWQAPIVTLALGDSANDLPMLDAADKAALVAKPAGGHEPYEKPGLYRSPYAGAKGWADSMEVFYAAA